MLPLLLLIMMVMIMMIDDDDADDSDASNPDDDGGHHVCDICDSVAAAISDLMLLYLHVGIPFSCTSVSLTYALSGLDVVSDVLCMF